MNAITVGRKKLDVFFILISLFMIILTFMIIYINKAHRDMKNYTTYHKQIKELSTLNQQIENSFLKKYHYVDHDALQSITSQFEESLNYLDQQKFVYKFEKKLKDEIAKLYSDYEQKDTFVQQFKSTNSRLTNSVHYLFDLHQNISHDNNISTAHKKLFDAAFFKIEQFAMDIPSAPEALKANIQKIKTIKEQHKYFQYFYQHANLFIQDMAQLQDIFEQNRHLNLANQIRRVSNQLEEHSKTMYEAQYQISLIFFIFGFFNLVFLIVNYKKINKLVQDLFTFKYTIENSDNLIIITDKNRKIEYVNEAFERKLGYNKEEIIGQKPSVMKSDLMSEQTYQNLNATLERNEKWEGEIINRRKDGSLIYEKASIIPIINKNKVQGFLSIKLDISEYMQQNSEIKYLNALFDYTQDRVLLLDQNGFILEGNPAFLDKTKYEMSNIYQKPLSSIHLQSNYNILNDETLKQLQEHKVFKTKVELLTRSNTPLTQELNIIAIYDNGVLRNYVVIYRD